MENRVLLTEEAGYVAVGSHIGVICETADEFFHTLREAFLIGLSENDCCIFADSPQSVRRFEELLKSSDIDVAGNVEEGKLVLISDRGALLRYGVEFEPDHTLSILGTMFQDKVRAGFDLVRLCINLSWLVRHTPGRERIAEFEEKADETINVPGVPMVAICHYLRSELEPEESDEILSRHPMIFTGGLLRKNPDYAS